MLERIGLGDDCVSEEVDVSTSGPPNMRYGVAATLRRPPEDGDLEGAKPRDACAISKVEMMREVKGMQ